MERDKRVSVFAVYPAQLPEIAGYITDIAEPPPCNICLSGLTFSNVAQL